MIAVMVFLCLPDVNTKNKDDVTPLHLAAKLDKEEVIELLLDK